MWQNTLQTELKKSELNQKRMFLFQIGVKTTKCCKCVAVLHNDEAEKKTSRTEKHMQNMHITKTTVRPRSIYSASARVIFASRWISFKHTNGLKVRRRTAFSSDNKIVETAKDNVSLATLLALRPKL